MKTIITLFTALISIALFQSCTKHHCSSAPSCIQSRIDQTKNDPQSLVKQVDEYVFQGSKVYVFVDDPAKMSDPGANVYTANCTSLCFLGGIGALTTCNGVNFYDNAQFKQTIWKR